MPASLHSPQVQLSQATFTQKHQKHQKLTVNVIILAIVLLTSAQQHFTILEVVAAEWHELAVPWRIMQPCHPLPVIANNWTHGAA